MFFFLLQLLAYTIGCYRCNGLEMLNANRLLTLQAKLHSVNYFFLSFVNEGNLALLISLISIIQSCARKGLFLICWQVIGYSLQKDILPYSLSSGGKYPLVNKPQCMLSHRQLFSMVNTCVIIDRGFNTC